MAEQHIAEAWRRGRLRWLLYEDQRRLYDFLWEHINRPEPEVIVVNVHRQRGKSFIVGAVADEFARKNPGSQIRFVTGTQKALRKIVHPTLRELLRTCPRDLRPQWNSSDSYYAYPGGSELHLAGANDGHADDSRGQRAHLCVVDEAGFVDDLGYLVDSVLLPQTLSTGGKVILISTPPLSPAHAFFAYAMHAEAEERYIVSPIDECTHISEVRKKALIDEVGGPESTEAQREYFCKFVADASKAVLPEFAEVEKDIVREPPPCEWYFPLVALDVGFEDLTAALFGYYDFARALLVIVDELYLKHARTDQIADGVKAKEAALWPWAAREQERDEYGSWVVDSWRPQRRHVRRTSDIDLRLIADLGALHKLGFARTDKSDTKEARINAFRVRLRERSVIVHPRCKTTIAHFKTALWHVTRQGMRTTFEHSENEGHFDGVDAAVYLNRMAPRQENPMPPKYGSVDRLRNFVPDHVAAEGMAGPWGAIFSGSCDVDEEGTIQ